MSAQKVPLLLQLLFVLFVGLKLSGHIAWSWWWVFAPLWGCVVWWLVLGFVQGFIVAFRRAYRLAKTKRSG